MRQHRRLGIIAATSPAQRVRTKIPTPLVGIADATSYRAMRAGVKQREIAQLWHIHPSRVSQLITKAEQAEWEKAGSDPIETKK